MAAPNRAIRPVVGVEANDRGLGSRIATDRDTRNVDIIDLTVPNVRFPEASEEQKAELARVLERDADPADDPVEELEHLEELGLFEVLDLEELGAPRAQPQDPLEQFGASGANQAGVALAASDADEQGIEQAVQDYVSSIYDLKPELLDGSVSPKLQKVGYMPAQDGSGLEESWMTFQELKDLAGHLNKDGMFDPETSPRKVTILDHTDMIANVKLEAAWGIDYIHLTKISGEWMIMNIIWVILPGLELAIMHLLLALLFALMQSAWLPLS